MHYLCLTAYICKSKLYIQSPESYNYTSIQPVTVIYVNLFKYYFILIKLHYIIFYKKLYGYTRHYVTINLSHSKPTDLFTHIEYSHRVLKVTLSLPIENNNYCYQIEYQLFGIRLIQRSIIMNLYKVYDAFFSSFFFFRKNYLLLSWATSVRLSVRPSVVCGNNFFSR